MKRWTKAALAGLLVVGLAAPAFAEETTVTGELVTVMCYTKNGDKGRGDAHLSCATKCANEGYPLAIVTSDGALYKITGTLTADKNAQLKSLLAKPYTPFSDANQASGAGCEFVARLRGEPGILDGHADREVIQALEHVA